MPSLAEDLMLLFLDDDSGRPLVDRTALDNVMAGAVLLELATLERVTQAEPGEDVKTGRLVVRDGTATGDPVFDTAIERLKTKPVKAQRAVELLSKGAREGVLDGLVERGLVQREQSKVLGLFPRTSWPAVDTEHEGWVRERLSAVLIDGRAPDQHTASLIVLLHAADSVHKVQDGQKKQLRARAKEIANGDCEWASEAVRKAIQQVQDNITVAIAAGVAAGAAAGGGGS